MWRKQKIINRVVYKYKKSLTNSLGKIIINKH